MFGDVLRKHRIAAALTQDELADRAGLSPKAVSSIERGIRRRPYSATVSSLAAALELSGAALADFRGAAARAGAPKAGIRAVSREACCAGPLPIFRTPYIRRPAAEFELTQLLKDHSLVTIHGTGGAGKTRLAVHVAAQLQSSPYESVIYFDCTAQGDDASANRIVETVSHAVDAHKREDRPRARRVFVVLDGCERDVLTVCRIIQCVRALSPVVTVITTSRQRLRLSDETPYALSGLPIEDAVGLFHERALAHDVTFALSPAEHNVVVDICRRLEGMPLAVELAAARTDRLSVFEIREELFSNFAILATRNRDLPGRQQSLAASIDWSLGALGDDERELLRRLTAFRGDFTLDAVVAVARDAANGNSAMTLLGSLIDKSLVEVDSGAATFRYRLAEATRALVRDAHMDVRTRAASARAHATWLARFADEADATYLRLPHGIWAAKMSPWLDDARAAVTWSLGEGNDPLVAGRIIGGLRGIWRTAGLASECRRWVEVTLPLLDAQEHPAMVSRVYRAFAQASTGLQRVEASLRAKALAEVIDDRVMIAASLTMLTEGFFEMGQYAVALATVNRNAELIEGEGLRNSLLYARTHYDRSLIFRASGEAERVRDELVAAMRIAGVTGDDWIALDVQSVTANVAFDAGKLADALLVVEEALRHARRLGWDVFVVSLLNSVAMYQLALHHIDDALRAAVDALTLARGRDALAFDTSVEQLATIAALRGRHEQAALLHGFVETSLNQKTYVRPRSERTAQKALVTQLQSRLDADRLATLARAGRSLTESVVVDLALAAATA